MRNIIVIGASAGGIAAIKKLLTELDTNLDASIFIVQHLSRDSNALALAEIFQKQTAFLCNVAVDGMPINSGNLYLAPADKHLMLENDRVIVTSGAKENKYRPSIDVLFRSAAVNYGNRVIGIILTGMLEDGTSGMSAIKRCGGICIVQNPNSSEFFSMPQSVINNVAIDYTAELSEIPRRIYEIANRPLPTAVPVPPELQTEFEITKRMKSGINQLKSIGIHSDFACPDCGGGLWEIKNDVTHRYRCYTGHVFTEKMLQELQIHGLEESLWVSIRMLEERANLLKVMATRNTENNKRSADYSQRIDETLEHVERLKKLLADLAA